LVDEKKAPKQFTPQLVMFRDSLEALPKITLKDGYTIRSFQNGDEKHWERIIQQSFGKEISFQRTMKEDEAFCPERIKFVCYQDQPVATASAWYRQKWGPNTGYLHMVGCDKQQTGIKLGYWVSLAALYQFQYEGRINAILETDDFRLPAIKTYLNLKFEPHIIHDNQHDRWTQIVNKLNTPPTK